MRQVALTCSDVSHDRLVAYFKVGGEAANVFAYLPHVPGLNPHLLCRGDRIDGTVVERNGRLELVSACGQVDRRRA